MSTTGSRLGAPAFPTSGVYALKWNNFSQHLATGLRKLFDEDDYTDVTLACDGQFIRAHKFLLSLCSPFFKKLFQVNTNGAKNNDTIVILNNVRFKDLESILRFIYNGEANVNNADLSNFLQTGELLQIEGLSGLGNEQVSKDVDNIAVGSAQYSRTKLSPRVISPDAVPVRPAPHVQGNTSIASSRQVKNQNSVPGHAKSKAQISGCMEPSYDAILPEDVDPLDIRDEDGHYTRDNINEDAETESEMLVNMSDLKNEQYQYYSSEPTNEESMVFDSSANGSNAYTTYDRQETDPVRKATAISYNQPKKPKQVLPNNASQPRAVVTRASSSVTKRAVATLRKKTRKQRNKYSKCLYCNAEIYRSNLSRHMATVHTKLLLAEGKRLFRCSICKATYRTLTHLQYHMQKHEIAI